MKKISTLIHVLNFCLMVVALFFIILLSLFYLGSEETYKEIIATEKLTFITARILLNWGGSLMMLGGIALIIWFVNKMIYPNTKIKVKHLLCIDLIILLILSVLIILFLHL